MLKRHKTNNSGNNFLFIFVFLLSSVANMVANYVCICIKHISKVFG